MRDPNPRSSLGDVSLTQPAPQNAAELAERQHGVVAIRQLHALGYTADRIHGLTASDGWRRVSRLVLRREGSPCDVRQRAMAAVLDAGAFAALSHESASAWYGHRGSRLERPIHVVTTQSVGRRATLGRVHQVRLLPTDLVVLHDGVPTVCAELVALHLFATMPFARAERIVETMWSRRMLSGRSIGLLLHRLARQGRNGIVALRQYHDARGDDYSPPASGLEHRVSELLRSNNLELRRQVWVGEEAPIGRADLLHPELPLVVEVQSEMHHTSLTDRTNDSRRSGALRAAGFVVVEIPEEWVWTDPARVVDSVRVGIHEAARSKRPPTLQPAFVMRSSPVER